MAWVYILRCCDGSYYVGSTPDLARRVAEHGTGAFPNCYTFPRRPIVLVFSYEATNIEEAFYLERQFKGWSRKKKEALIAGRYDLLHELARCRNSSRSAG
jgi:putative endonuclease